MKSHLSFIEYGNVSQVGKIEPFSFSRYIYYVHVQQMHAWESHEQIKSAITENYIIPLCRKNVKYAGCRYEINLYEYMFSNILIYQNDNDNEFVIWLIIIIL